MVVLVDTNVVIDFLTTREPFYEASSKVIMKCASEEIEGHIAIHSIPNLWYILRKTSEENRRKWLLDICKATTPYVSQFLGNIRRLSFSCSAVSFRQHITEHQVQK